MMALGRSCPVCAGTDVREVLSLSGLPLAINAQVHPEEATSVPRSDIDLVVCRSCSHLYNHTFEPQASLYDASYENSLHFSPRFQEHARALAARLVAEHDLAGSTVVELGAGPGHFLAMLCDAGAAEGHGFDPSYDPDRLGAPEHPAVNVSSNLFPDDGSLSAKFAMSQHVLEHVADPVTLLRSMRRLVAQEPDGVIYNEVPNGETMIDRCALWDLVYEHYSYFTPVSLEYAGARAGLTIDAMVSMFDDQFLAMDASVAGHGGREEVDLPPGDVVGPLVERAAVFGRDARARIVQAREELDMYRDAGPVALWGAGSKGRTYLNIVAPEGELDAIVDVNPRKDGRGVPGVPGVIRLPESLREVGPATVLISNPVYADEIRESLADLGIDANVQLLWK